MTAHWQRFTSTCALLLAAAGCADREPLYYVDPMHPTYRSDEPGIAPDCGMRLVPVYQAAAAESREHHQDGLVRLTADQQRRIGARIDAARRQSGRQSLRLFARVVPDETRLYKVNVGVAGFVKELSDVTAGSIVSKNQWLVTISAPEARSAISAYLVAEDTAARERSEGGDSVQVSLADASVQQARDRLVNVGMSSVQMDQIRQSGTVPADIQLAAPGPGIVLSRRITAGERFERGAELYQIADLRRVWISADLARGGAAHVKPGMSAKISIPGQITAWPATVGTSVPEFDPATQSLKVRLIAENPALVLRPGMFVDVELAVDLPEGVTVPLSAVIDAGRQKLVFVERDPGVFERREVQTGWRSGDEVEIVSGLAEGEQVVTSGAFFFASESGRQQARPGAIADYAHH